MKKLFLLVALAVVAGSASAQTGHRRMRSNARMTRAQTDTMQYMAPDSSETDRGSGFESTPGLSPRTEKSDPDSQADQKSNATDPQNQTYEKDPTRDKRRSNKR